jgi:hypothetical protein
MQRPKWLIGWGKGKNIFEGSLIVDIPEIKVVEASFNKNLVLFAVGTARKIETPVSDEGNAKENGSKSNTDLDWKIFYDPTALPHIIPIDKAKDLMAGTVAASSGSTAVYNTRTIYIASGNRPSKGNAPVLMDYELAKKIEEAKKLSLASACLRKS